MNTKTAFTSGYQRREKNRQSRPTKTWMEEIKITAGELLFGKTEQNGEKNVCKISTVRYV